jgi:hypothetical protein
VLAAATRAHDKQNRAILFNFRLVEDVASFLKLFEEVNT